jgi:hypothetical protein
LPLATGWPLPPDRRGWGTPAGYPRGSQDGQVQIDLSTHRVQIESSNASAEALRDIIKEAGYTPVAATAAPAQAVKAAPRGGCCCG